MTDQPKPIATVIMLSDSFAPKTTIVMLKWKNEQGRVVSHSKKYDMETMRDAKFEPSGVFANEIVASAPKEVADASRLVLKRLLQRALEGKTVPKSVPIYPSELPKAAVLTRGRC